MWAILTVVACLACAVMAFFGVTAPWFGGVGWLGAAILVALHEMLLRDHEKVLAMAKVLLSFAKATVDGEGGTK
jgi:hypothetical protein